MASETKKILYDPLFDNTLPEGRALNRTVTVTLEYEQKE